MARRSLTLRILAKNSAAVGQHGNDAVGFDSARRQPDRQATILWLICVALCLFCTKEAAAQPAAPPPTPVLIDRWMSPGAGATVTNGVARLVAGGEEQFVPLRLFEDEGKLRHAANATYRLFKFALFDEPQENWFRVANHELFGHGGRIRELFDGRISYQLPAPPPYGRGGGATFFEFDRVPTVEEVLAVTVGGMESNYLVARALAQDAMTAGTWNYRDALRYLYTEYDTIHYIRSVGPIEEAGHDVGDFIRIYNGVATEAGEDTISSSELRRNVLVSFANPLIAYSYYSSFVSYVWQGRTTAPVPMIHLGATRYLPMMRFHLTSFGPEFVLDNAFVRNGRFIDATVTWGQTVGSRTWSLGGLGTRLVSGKDWTIGGAGRVWHRPDWGGQFAVTASRQLAARGAHAFAFVAEGGFKTDGFAPGDRLHQGAFLRIGTALTPTSRRLP